jgi:siroheme synthase
MPRGLPVLIMENATLPQARRVALTLAELPRISAYGFEGPTVIMLGVVFAPALAAAAESALLYGMTAAAVAGEMGV